ncbi:uncharacterized protein LOC119459598 [Dermacentor silvarum]|uniref:uncharacterized protein LOC119459598 n=1 Tax=Dermacentor silvarum TaxID=543639 RepID=UPI002101C475|nr:uncharacterized protein LOC119459598 [Dermacentor silvarum]
MKIFVSALLVGLAGTVAHAHPGFHELSDSVELSERAADITKCKAKAPNTTKACKLNDVSSVGFYGYNPKKKKCMKYPHCSFITGDAFSSREKCYQTCDESSPCLDTSYSEYHDVYPFGVTPTTYHYYDPYTDDCVEIDTYGLDASDFWPNHNVFTTYKKCRNECAPTYSKRKPRRH